MNVSPSPAGHLFFDRLEKFVFKKSWIEIFRFQISKFPDFRFQKFSDFRFQNFQISDFKIFRFRKISKFSDFEISKSVDASYICCQTPLLRPSQANPSLPGSHQESARLLGHGAPTGGAQRGLLVSKAGQQLD